VAVPTVPAAAGRWHNCCAKNFQRTFHAGSVILRKPFVLQGFSTVAAFGIPQAEWKELAI
jgi:hypothetical protein